MDFHELSKTGGVICLLVWNGNDTPSDAEPLKFLPSMTGVKIRSRSPECCVGGDSRWMLLGFIDQFEDVWLHYTLAPIRKLGGSLQWVLEMTWGLMLMLFEWDSH